MIEFQALSIVFRRRDGDVRALRDFSIDVQSGEAVALVGESGSGKTTAARAVLGDIGASGEIESGSVSVAGQDSFVLQGAELAAFRRRHLGYVPQNPGASLNPVRRVGRQIAEMVGGDRRANVARLLERVQLDPTLADRYPHQLSGGQQQRVSLAIALANEPVALVLDEPTTGLDVGVQVEILRLFRGLAEEGLAVLYVTHDLAAAAVVADRIAVLYAGDVLETGPLRDVYRRPSHPYTEALLAAVPSVSSFVRLAGIPGQMLAAEQRNNCCVFHNRCAYAEERCAKVRPALEAHDGRTLRCFRSTQLSLAGVTPRLDVSNPDTKREPAETLALLSVERVTVAYRNAQRKQPPAVDCATLLIGSGETVALVGESGSGKTSLARGIAGLVRPASGTVRLGVELLPASYRKRSREQLRRIQYIFQNSSLALNPRHEIERTLRAPLLKFFDLSTREQDERIRELLEMVALPKRLLSSRPRELSGGEQQRIAIARALSARPDVVICDEIVSALDVSVQAAIVKLLGDLQEQTGIAMLFISHDLGVVRAIADRTAVMHGGVIVEEGLTDRIFRAPEAAYTKALLKSVPDAASIVHSA